MDLLLHVNGSDILCLMFYKLYLYGAEISNIDINNVANSGYQVYSTNSYGLSHLYWSTLEFTQLQ